MKEYDPSLERMRECILGLRRDGGLPDPNLVGSAGSFFKSLLITEEEGRDLLASVSGSVRERLAPRLKAVEGPGGERVGFKLGAGALIQAFGLDGAFVGGACLHRGNPVVLVNASGKATANEVLLLAKRIRATIFERTGLQLEIEPDLVGFTADEEDFYLDLRYSAGEGDGYRNGGSQHAFKWQGITFERGGW